MLFGSSYVFSWNNPTLGNTAKVGNGNSVKAFEKSEYPTPLRFFLSSNAFDQSFKEMRTAAFAYAAFQQSVLTIRFYTVGFKM